MNLVNEYKRRYVDFYFLLNNDNGIKTTTLKIKNENNLQFKKINFDSFFSAFYE